MPLTSGMIGSRRVSASETPSEISVATMNSAVATNSGPPNAASAGNFSGQPFAAGIGEEEHGERPQFERELEQRVDRLLAGFVGGGFEGHGGLLMPNRVAAPVRATVRGDGSLLLACA